MERHVPGMFDRSRVPSGNLFHRPLRRHGYSASFSMGTRGGESQAATGSSHSSHDPQPQLSHRRPSAHALESYSDFVVSRPMSLHQRMSGVGSMQTVSDLFDSEHPPAHEAPAREGSQDNAFKSASRGFSRSVACHSRARVRGVPVPVCMAALGGIERCRGACEGIGENQSVTERVL